MKVLIVCAVVAVLGILYAMRQREFISGAEAKAMVASGAKLIDVRTPAEFAAGHIAGAVNIPVDQLDARLEQVGAKSQPIVVYCRSGARSARAKRLLEQEGYEKVENLGGIQRWP